MVFNNQPIQIWSFLYVSGGAYFGTQTGAEIQFQPGSTIFVGNYLIEVNSYRFIQVGGSEKLKVGKVVCLGCKFTRFGNDEGDVSALEALMLEVKGVKFSDLPRGQKDALSNKKQVGALARIENYLAESLVQDGYITGVWADYGKTVSHVGAIKVGEGGSVEQAGGYLSRIPTDIIMELAEVPELNPKMMLKGAEGKLGEMIVRGEWRLGQHALAGEDSKKAKQLQLPSSELNLVDLQGISKQTSRGDAFSWVTLQDDTRRSPIVLKCENLNLVPITFLPLNAELREYIKFPFDICGLLGGLGFQEHGEHYIIGDKQYIYKLVNQLSSSIGLVLEGREAFLNILAKNALYESFKNKSLKPGVALSGEARRSLGAPIVWPVWKSDCFYGKKCLNFEVYYQNKNVVELDRDKANIRLVDSHFELSSDLKVSPETKLILKDSSLEIAGAMLNRGIIEGLGKAMFSAQSIMQQGEVRGRGEIGFIAEEDFIMEMITNVVSSSFYSNRYVQTNVILKPEINHEGKVFIKTQGNTELTGVSISADSLYIEAGDKVLVLPKEIYSYFSQAWKDGSFSRESVEHKLIEIAVNNDIKIISKQGNYLYAPQIKAGGDVLIASQLGENQISAVVDKHKQISYREEESGLLFWSSTRAYRDEDEFAISKGAEIDSRGLKIESGKGTMLEGARVSARWVVLNALEEAGAKLQLLPATEMSISSSYINKESLFRSKTQERSALNLKIKPTIIYVKQECKIENNREECVGGYFLGYSQGTYMQLSSEVTAETIRIKAPLGITLESLHEVQETKEYVETSGFGVHLTLNSEEVSLSIGMRVSENTKLAKSSLSVPSILSGKQIYLETEGTFRTVGAQITADEILKTKSKSEVHEVAYNTETISEHNYKFEAGFKIGAQSSIGRLIDSAKELANADTSTTEGGINAVFSSYQAYSNLVDIAASDSLVSVGAWFSAEYQQSQMSHEGKIVVATVIEAGTYVSESEHLKLKSTQIKAYNAYFSAQTMEVEAAYDEFTSTIQGHGADINIPIWGDITPRAGMQDSNADAESLSPINAIIKVSNELNINIEGKASIKGASISAKSLHGAFGELILESMQDIIKSQGYNWGLSSGLAKNRLISGANFGNSNYNRNVVSELSYMIGEEAAEVVVTHALHLNGAMIANAEIDESGEYTDHGKLVLTVGELFVKHIRDYDKGFTLGGSFALGNKLSQSSSNPFSNSYTATFGGKDGSGLTRATIGQGSLSCTLGGAGYDSCGRGAAEVNRDVSRAQDFSYKHNIDAIKFIYIDPREVAAKTEEAVKRLKSGKLWPDTQALFKGAAERIEEFVEGLRADEAKKAEAEDGAAKKAEAVEGEVAVAEEEGVEKPAKKGEKSQKKKAKEAATRKDLEKEQPEEKESETDKVKLSAAEEDIVQRFEEGQEKKLEQMILDEEAKCCSINIYYESDEVEHRKWGHFYVGFKDHGSAEKEQLLGVNPQFLQGSVLHDAVVVNEKNYEGAKGPAAWSAKSRFGAPGEYLFIRDSSSDKKQELAKKFNVPEENVGVRKHEYIEPKTGLLFKEFDYIIEPVDVNAEKK